MEENDGLRNLSIQMTNFFIVFAIWVFFSNFKFYDM